jgi:hypothetical protein
MVWEAKTTEIVQFRLATKHSHMNEDQIGGSIRTAAKGNKRHFGIFASFTPVELATHVEGLLERAHPAAIVACEWVNAVHDWADHQASWLNVNDSHHAAPTACCVVLFIDP